MQNKRLLIFISAVLISLILLGGLIGTVLRIFNELRYSLEYFLPYWLVTPIIFIGIIIITLLIIQYGWPWWKKFINKRMGVKLKNRKIEFTPKSRLHAAKRSLESIDILIERIQDQVSREGLRQEREKVNKELKRGDLVVVIFGTGSSGKTSLIRALLNEIVGEVSASMGSTSKSKMYRLRLKSLNRGIQLIDTPGLFETGTNGISREKEARLKATRADLMIFVLDSDLRSNELETIQNLINLGKRLILVLNKCDLRGVEEERRILLSLKGYCKGLIQSEDIVSTSASPQSIPRTGKNPLQPKPEINSLLKRLAYVLSEDGEELLADNILLQCRSLGDKGRQLLSSQRNKYSRRCIDRYSWISSGVVAVTPLPGVDMLAAAAVNAQMVMEIAKIYGIQLTKARAQELAVSVGRTLAGLGVIKGGVSLISGALTLNIPTMLAGRAIQSVAAAWLTRIAGDSFNTYFQQDQDWGDGGIQEVVQHHYDLNRRDSALKRFLDMAVSKVVEPLQKNQRQLAPRQRPLKEEVSWGHEHQE